MPGYPALEPVGEAVDEGVEELVRQHGVLVYYAQGRLFGDGREELVAWKCEKVVIGVSIGELETLTVSGQQARQLH